jgi:hypothetical protein
MVERGYGCPESAGEEDVFIIQIRGRGVSFCVVHDPFSRFHLSSGMGISKSFISGFFYFFDEEFL